MESSVCPPSPQNTYSYVPSCIYCTLRMEVKQKAISGHNQKSYTTAQPEKSSFSSCAAIVWLISYFKTFIICPEIQIIRRPSAHSICLLYDHLPIPACPYPVFYRILPFFPTTRVIISALFPTSHVIISALFPSSRLIINALLPTSWYLQ